MWRFIIFLVVVTILALVVDLYAFQAVKSATRDFSPNARRIANIIYWSLTLFTLIAVAAGLLVHYENWPKLLRTYVFSTILIIILAKVFFIIPIILLEDITRGIRYLFSTPVQAASDTSGVAISRSTFIGQLALLIGGIPVGLGLHGMIRNPYNYKIHRLKVKLPHLPEAFNGLRIVQISDVHSGSFTAKKPVARGIEMINKENPDLVFFTGDIVNYRAEEMLDYINIFKNIKAKEGIFATMGNHDYADYVRYESQQQREEGKRKNRQLLKDIYKEMGWDLLLNENRILRRGKDSIAIIGSENWSANKRFHCYGDMEKAYKGAETADVKLLLSHDPTHWDAEVSQDYRDIDITFAGHTHGAQLGIEVPGYIKISPAQLIYKHWAGLYQQANQYLYVNRGYGFIGYHGRIGILPEITVMELEKG